MNKFTNIKERIRYIADLKGVTKEIFFKEIGMTSANFRGDKVNRPINSDAIDKIITLYPDIDLYWLITGKEKSENKSKGNTANNELPNNYKEIEAIRKDIGKSIEELLNIRLKLVDQKLERISKFMTNLEIEETKKDKKKKD